MLNQDHHYAVRVEWTGNTGTGTTGYRDYGRDNLVTAQGNPPIMGSADGPFRGSPERWNPEQLLLAALSQCHMLSYLHVAVKHGLVVTSYHDDATGTMQQVGEGGHFTSVTLRPAVTLGSGNPEVAQAIHAEASALCFIANSVNFPVLHEPRAILER
ncbi:OsmC family protein [Salinibacterium sp.]|uniref:OsmC family protein n=1 Tax=Salinibacterium sp. TaxID=1915057 RepID=UPI00286B4991|nr:OsmC family protein [Salinibacterium sp.]